MEDNGTALRDWCRLGGTATAYIGALEQRDNFCTPVCIKTPDGNGCRKELQTVLAHEGTHWFWLGDMSDDQTDRELTMSPRPPFYDRWRSTLALGDVLGLRALYPCSCPLPPIYSP